MEVLVIHKSLCYPLSLRAELKKFPNKARIIGRWSSVTSPDSIPVGGYTGQNKNLYKEVRVRLIFEWKLKLSYGL